jgi:hypothetical protein
MRFSPYIAVTGDALRAKVERRRALEDACFAKAHRDYRGGTGEARTLLRYISGVGTCAVLLSSIPDEELIAKLSLKEQEALTHGP